MKKNIASLQVLRGIAALFVLIYHGAHLTEVQLHSFSPHTFWFGYSGVDMFFVLSGFIIYYTNFNKSGVEAAKLFFIRRFIRVIPIYWVAVFTTVLIFLVAKYVFHISAVNSSICDRVGGEGWGGFVASMFLIPKWATFVGVAWTLSFECVFYVLFGLLFFRNPRLLIAALLVWIFCCYFTALYAHVNFDKNQNPLIALLDPIATEFLFGCGVAILFIRHQFSPIHWISLLIIGLVAFSSTIFFLKDTLIAIPTLNQVSRVFVFGLPSALIIFGIIHIKGKFPKILTYLGDASYSIYLFHYPILGSIAKFLVLTKMSNHFSNYWGADYV